MSNVRTHIRSVINSSRRRRVVTLSLLIFCLAAGVRLVSIEAAGSTAKGFISPNPPSGLTVSVVSSSSLRLQWQDNSSNETSFSIYRCQGSSCTPFGSIASIGADLHCGRRLRRACRGTRRTAGGAAARAACREERAPAGFAQRDLRHRIASRFRWKRYRLLSFTSNGALGADRPMCRGGLRLTNENAAGNSPSCDAASAA